MVLALSLGFIPSGDLPCGLFYSLDHFTFSNGGISIKDMAFSCFGLTISLGFGYTFLLRQNFLASIPLNGLLRFSLILAPPFTTWASDAFIHNRGAFGKQDDASST